jgi:hypothetical protein
MAEAFWGVYPIKTRVTQMGHFQSTNSKRLNLGKLANY